MELVDRQCFQGVVQRADVAQLREPYVGGDLRVQQVYSNSGDLCGTCLSPESWQTGVQQGRSRQAVAGSESLSAVALLKEGDNATC